MSQFNYRKNNLKVNIFLKLLVEVFQKVFSNRGSNTHTAG